jgi:hypothetical protein
MKPFTDAELVKLRERIVVAEESGKRRGMHPVIGAMVWGETLHRLFATIDALKEEKADWDRPGGDE